VNGGAATAAYGLPIAAALALWWTSTGAVLYLDARDSRTYGRTFICASVIALGAVLLAAAVRDDLTIRGAVLAFFAGLACWAWQLVGFYTGFITGPRKAPCADDSVGWRRFVEAVRTSLHHEIAAMLGALALAALSARASNPVALWTYLILWGMHASAKLNLFFGVPNHGEDLLPKHLAHLKSYMARRPMNLFFPVSVTLATLAAALLAQRAWGAADAFDGASNAMLATLMALAVLEHWFLVVPIDGNALWGFARRRNETGLTEGSEAWSLAPPAVCDQRDLREVLALIASGAFGDIDSMQGVARTQGQWVRFELSGRGANIAAFEPRLSTKPLVTAIGRRLDREGLQAAFARCAA
jgi:putative photosynthetic complex assembly protein 2